MTNQTLIVQLANKLKSTLDESKLSHFDKSKALALVSQTHLWGSDGILLNPVALESSLDSLKSSSSMEELAEPE